MITTMLATTQKEAAPTKKTRRILYADDLQELRDMVQITLARDGHAVACAADGLLAWERIAAEPGAFDLVITDHHMPNMNGLELVTRLRALPFAGKILLFSSGLSNEVCEAYHRLKVDYILHKPVFPHELRQALAKL
jgi:two-component system, chemotaxis family, chemotaxis protein CheY